MEIRSVACFSFSLAAGEPMAYVRLIAPLRALGICILDGFQMNGDLEDVVSEADIVVFQRESTVRFDIYKQVVEIARERGKPVVLELDDLLFFLPETHPDRKKHYYAPTLLPMLQALVEADAVIVPTTRMQEILKAYNNNVFVIPNYFDDFLWSFREPLLRNSPDHQQLVIGYMGTDSHQPDLGFVAPVLQDILNRYGERLKLRFWGIKPPAQLHNHPQVEWISCKYRSYEAFASFFQTQSADIFIAPLIDNLFNRCKSPLKFFEYSALGAPGVYSRLDPYIPIVQHGQTGMLAYSLDEWGYCLIQLIESSEMRFQLARGAQSAIKKRWLLSRNIDRWQRVFHRILEGKKGKKKLITPLILDILTAVNTQMFEAIQALNAQLEERDQTIQALNAQLEERDQTIQALNQEIIGYVLSRSWRMTRPLRLIGRSIQRLKGKKE